MSPSLLSFLLPNVNISSSSSFFGVCCFPHRPHPNCVSKGNRRCLGQEEIHFPPPSCIVLLSFRLVPSLQRLKFFLFSVFVFHSPNPPLKHFLRQEGGRENHARRVERLGKVENTAEENATHDHASSPPWRTPCDTNEWLFFGGEGGQILRNISATSCGHENVQWSTRQEGERIGRRGRDWETRSHPVGIFLTRFVRVSGVVVHPWWAFAAAAASTGIRGGTNGMWKAPFFALWNGIRLLCSLPFHSPPVTTPSLRFP